MSASKALYSHNRPRKDPPALSGLLRAPMYVDGTVVSKPEFPVQRCNPHCSLVLLVFLWSCGETLLDAVKMTTLECATQHYTHPAS